VSVEGCAIACGKEETGGSMLLVKKYFQVTNKQQPSKNGTNNNQPKIASTYTYRSSCGPSVCDGTSKKVLVTGEQKRKATYNWKGEKQRKKELFVIAVTSISENVNIIKIGTCWV
jgi:hypothetical protein